MLRSEPQGTLTALTPVPCVPCARWGNGLGEVQSFAYSALPIGGRPGTCSMVFTGAQLAVSSARMKSPGREFSTRGVEVGVSKVTSACFLSKTLMARGPFPRSPGEGSISPVREHQEVPKK